MCPSESLLLFHLMSSYRMNDQTSADASDVLYKLVVFALLTAIVPVTAYFGSVRYLFDGEWSCSGYYSAVSVRNGHCWRSCSSAMTRERTITHWTCALDPPPTIHH